ncbi:hypothetical protein VTK26DRAFT_3182 [Humicola hyalothermophila]
MTKILNTSESWDLGEGKMPPTHSHLRRGGSHCGGTWGESQESSKEKKIPGESVPPSRARSWRAFAPNPDWIMLRAACTSLAHHSASSTTTQSHTNPQ